MKRLNYTFSKREKLLILFLVVVMIGVGYYYFVNIYVVDSIKSSEYELENLQMEYDALTMRMMNAQKMQNEMQELDLSTLSHMESYNASKKEISFLNDLLINADDYNINFGKISRTGDIVRRPFSLSFTVSSYQEAIKILSKLANSEQRCLIENVTVSASDNTGNLYQGKVTVSLTAAFHETMEGGIEDAGLPVDSTTE